MNILPQNAASPRLDLFQTLRRQGATVVNADPSASGAAQASHSPGTPTSTSNKTPDLIESYVGQRLRSALDGQDAKAASSAKPARFEDFSPAAVAGRIVDFVGQRLAKVEDADKRAALLDQARQGIEQGFADARDVLKGMGMLQGGVAQNIDDTYGRVMDGLDRLGRGGSADTVPTVTDPATATPMGQAAAASFAQVETNAVSLSIQTADGDRINFRFRGEQGAALTAFASQGRDGAESGASLVQYQSSDLGFSVEGDLDAGEQKAIAALVKDVQGLAGRFFNGDVQAAFQQAAKMGFDNQELAGFSLKLTQTVETRAVAAYQSTAATATAPAPSIQDAVSATADLRKLFQSAQASQVFADPGQALSDLFGGIAKAQGLTQQPETDPALQRVQDLLGQFTGSDYALS